MCPTPLSFHPLFRVESSLNLLFHFHLKRLYCVSVKLSIHLEIMWEGLDFIHQDLIGS